MSFFQLTNLTRFSGTVLNPGQVYYVEVSTAGVYFPGPVEQIQSRQTIEQVLRSWNFTPIDVHTEGGINGKDIAFTVQVSDPKSAQSLRDATREALRQAGRTASNYDLYTVGESRAEGSAADAARGVAEAARNLGPAAIGAIGGGFVAILAIAALLIVSK